MKLKSADAFRHRNFERGRGLRRKIVSSNQGAVAALAEAQALGRFVGDHTTQGSLRSEREALRGVWHLTLARRCDRKSGFAGLSVGDRCISPHDHSFAFRAGSDRFDIEKHASRIQHRFFFISAQRLSRYSIEREMMLWIHLQRHVVDDQRTFVACSADGGVTSCKQPQGPGGHVLLQVVARYFSLGFSRLSGDLVPSRRRFRSRIAERFRRHHGQNVPGETPVNALARSQFVNRPATAVHLPRDKERLAVTLQSKGKAALA